MGLGSAFKIGKGGLRFAPHIGKLIKDASPWVGEAAVIGGTGAALYGVGSRAVSAFPGANEALNWDADSVAENVKYDLNESLESQSRANLGDWLRHVTTGVSKDDVTAAAQADAVKLLNRQLDADGRQNMLAGYKSLGIEPPSYLDLEWNDGDSTEAIKANQNEAKQLLQIYQNLPSDISIQQVAGKPLQEVNRILATSKFSPETEVIRTRDRQNAADKEALRQQRWQEHETVENRKQRAHETAMANKLALGKLGLEEGRIRYEMEDRRYDREDRRRQDQRDRIAELISGLTQLGAGMAL